jgi:hypothetical protein
MSTEDCFLNPGYKGATTCVGSLMSVPGTGSALGVFVRGGTSGIVTQGAIIMGMIQVTHERGSCAYWLGGTIRLAILSSLESADEGGRVHWGVTRCVRV